MNATLSVRRAVVALVTAFAAAMMLLVATPEADANPRGWLRPDATGHCLSLIHI